MNHLLLTILLLKRQNTKPLVPTLVIMQTPFPTWRSVI